MRKNWAMRHRIAVLVLDGVVTFDLGTVTQVFGAARDADLKRLYSVRVCGAGPARSAARFTITPDYDLSMLATADTVVVPGVDSGGPVTDGTLAPEVPSPRARWPGRPRWPPRPRPRR